MGNVTLMITELPQKDAAVLIDLLPETCAFTLTKEKEEENHRPLRTQYKKARILEPLLEELVKRNLKRGEIFKIALRVGAKSPHSAEDGLTRRKYAVQEGDVLLITAAGRERLQRFKENRQRHE